MKHLFACALAGVLCLAAASAHAQAAKRAAPPTKWQAHFGVISGATTAIQGRLTHRNEFLSIYEPETNQGTAALVAGVLGVTRAMSPRARLGADVWLGWTDTKFRTPPQPFALIAENEDLEAVELYNFAARSNESFFLVSNPVSYDFKTAINLRFFWDTQLRPLPMDVFALVGYQFRRALVGGTTLRNPPESVNALTPPLVSFSTQYTNEEIEHGYQIGLGADIGIIPSVPNLRWRLEYVFAENFRGNAYKLSSHDINLGFVYRFNLGKRQKPARR